MLFATAVSDLSIADALAEPRYRGVFVQLAQEVLAAAPVPVEPFDGFDADDLDGSIDRLVEFNRRSAKTHSGIYRDLMVRKRPNREVDADGDRRAAAPADARADHGDRGGPANLRGREPRPARRLPAAPGARAGAERGDHRAAAGRARRRPARCTASPWRSRTTSTSRASSRRTRRPSPCRRRPRATRPSSRRLRAAGADLLCKTNLLEYAAGSVNPAYGMTYNPRDPKPHVRRVELRLRRARRRRRRRLRARNRHRRVDPDPRRLLRHRRAEADLRARPGRRRVPALDDASTTSGRSRRPSPRRAACSRCWPASRSTRLRRRGSECCAASSTIRI